MTGTNSLKSLMAAATVVAAKSNVRASDTTLLITIDPVTAPNLIIARLR